MKKLYILEPKNKGHKEQSYWLNFRLSLDRKAWPGEELKKLYNASLVIDPDHDSPYILFETESDATMFLLRWS